MPDATTTTAVKERPILFSGPMVRAILDGKKTQTRRALKVQPLDVITEKRHTREWDGKRVWFFLESRDPNRGGVFHCRYGEVGDRLWVRETWCEDADEYGSPVIVYAADRTARFIGRTAERGDHLVGFDPIPFPEDPPRWRPSIFMPRWASRLLLEITDVRVQRLKAISHKDAVAEGAEYMDAADLRDERLTVPQVVFAGLWEKLNAKRGFAWDSNPWVWALTFRPLAADR